MFPKDFFKSVLLMIAGGLLLFSCSKTATETPENVIAVNVEEAVKFGDVSLFINTDTAAFYMLPQEPIIGTINKIQESENKLYIQDEIYKQLFIFDQTTGSLTAFDHYGGGPEDYTFITDFYVSGGKIYLLDNYANKVNIYTTDGEYIKTLQVNTDVWANELFVLDDYIFLINYGSKTRLGKYHIARVSPDGEIKTFIPFDRDPGMSPDNSYAVGDGFAYYVVRADNMIYKITVDNVEPCYYVDFGKEKMPDEYYSSNLYDIMTKGLQKEYSTGVSRIKYGDGLLFLYFTIKEEGYNLVFDTTNNSTLLFCRMFNPNKKLYDFDLGRFYMAGDVLYDRKTLDYIDSVFDCFGVTAVDEPYKSQMEKLRDERTPDDNPYIFKYWLKNRAK